MSTDLAYVKSLKQPRDFPGLKTRRAKVLNDHSQRTQAHLHPDPSSQVPQLAGCRIQVQNK